MADTSRMQKEAAQLDSVTDTVSQTELCAADTTKIQVAMQNLAAQQLAATQEAKQKEAELNKVKVADEDVKLLSDQFDMPTQKAERLLKECKGDVHECIRDFIRKEAY